MKEERQLFGHPIGLSILFFTELWERFSFYGMRGILVLYLTAETLADNPGLGFDNAKALSWYGTYTALVYIASIPGGLIADKILGQKISVLIGGILIIIGQFTLTAESTTAFIIGLALIISGVGMLKPNISTMVGGLYKQGDARRDAGFTLFYMGINIGAFSAPLLVGYVGEVLNWKWAFSLAGFGMIIGQIVYVFGWKYLKGVGNLITQNKETAHLAKKPLTKIEKDRMVVLFISFLIVLVFWAAYEQAGGLMNLFAKESVDRVIFGWEIPASFFQSLHAGFVIILAIPMAWAWDQWRKKGYESSSPFKMAIGSIVMSLGFVALMGAVMQLSASSMAKASMGWLFLSYGLHVVAELSISPVVLSFITKLAPAKYASIMMGLYFGVTGIGNKVAGLLGEAAQEAGEMAIFTGIAVFCLIFGLLLLVFVKKLKALAHGAEAVTIQE
jgi:POT family proton-dependent oligopeptide transporter